MARYFDYSAAPLPQVSDEISALADMAWEELSDAHSHNKPIPNGAQLILYLHKALDVPLADVRQAVIYMQLAQRGALDGIHGYHPIN